MYSKKFKLKNIELLTGTEGTGNALKDKVCYLAYFTPGERGWFLCECGNPLADPVHRIHTSEVVNVEYEKSSKHKVIVTTRNSKYVFEVIE